MPLKWQIKFDDHALKQLKKLDRHDALRIIKYLEERILSGANPRLWGKQLKGSVLGDMWRYRIGDYRALCIIKDDEVIVYVVSVGHRKEVYEH
jgi:mRNA interferase RelE/StbE